MTRAELKTRILTWLRQNAIPLAVLVFLVGCFLVTSFRKRSEGPQTGAIHVESVPSRAEVSIDGRLWGTAPLTIEDVAYGEHVLRFEKHGHEPVSRAVTVSEKEQTVRSTLKPIVTTVLRVESEPSGAAVRVGGEEVGWTPVVLEGVTPGRYEILVRKDGYKLFQKWISLSQGETRVLPCTLESKTEAVLEARAQESEASVRQLVELAHHHILSNDFGRAAPPLARALEMTAGSGEKNRWVFEEIEKPYWGRYEYGGAEAKMRCREMLEDVLIAEVKARPSHQVARNLLVELLRKAGRWERLAEAMEAGVIPIETASPRELGLYGEVMVQVGRADEVLDKMVRKHRRNRDCWELTYAIGLVHQQNGEKVKARIKFKQALLHCHSDEARARIQATLEGL
ncbi:MAG: PEGA domain-containing protein [Lentisphaerae bacterium]|jgi:hypothetical protein|nr:PEGA domain-containing protein [Lentisphaerota bacterium]MBT4821863.1 PEGA domain-containing protein [Lentisphaerota bacterium]MBT5610193.1 PEGA domain-containing protein [Lentisphaerota bacterium]MBT7057074.1 PEGA domain-containing protein [Lentisphaerota bacterium]MBT7846203.1 PEGA domain-containing protein [Lentisphaerota bacterium]